MSRAYASIRAEELAALLDSIEDYAIFLLGPDGEIRSWNLGATRTMGYSADEIIGKNFSTFYGAEDLAARKPQRELETASRSGRVEDEGWRIRKDGTRFWANTIITSLRDASGRITGFAKVTRDMTRRRDALEAVRRSEEIFRLLVASVRDYAIFLLDPGGHVMTWNTGAERLKGYKPHEIIGKHFSTFFPPETKETKPPWELEVAKRDGSVEDEGWRVRKDGTRFWANVIITAVYDEHKQLRGFAKVTRDMSDRKRDEEKLRRSEEIFRLLVASVKDYAIFLLDPTGHIVTWNAGAERLKGYTPDEIIGQHFSVFYPPETKETKPPWELEVARRDGSVEDEGWRVKKDGSRFWANVVITAVFDDRGELRGYAKVTRDMTDRKRAEETQLALFEQREARFRAEEERRRAEQAYRVAQETSRAKDEFLMTLSHELRTPLTAILGWSRLLTSMPPDDPTFRDALNAIGRSAQVQARLIDDVLDVSRIMSGKLRLDLENVDIVRVLNAAVDAVRPSADAKHIRIATSFAPHLGAIVADATRVQQIVWNLLSNAVKFTQRDGTVTLSARRSSSHVEISVLDTGEGIDRTFLPHIFEPFRQAESPTTRVHGGLGLGLSIVRYLVEAHGGTITAESEGRGSGATFTISLPFAAMQTDAAPATNAEPPAAAAAPVAKLLNGAKILLVDDDPEGRLMVLTVLRTAGANVTDVESAQAALEALALARPDIVISDIALPGFDGYQLARKIRAEYPGLTIVALTAFPPGRYAEHDELFDGYIVKPVEPTHLVDEVAARLKQ